MGIGEAVNVFTKLTIGDGLVSQVPAFLISLASGIIVTRSSSSTDLNRDVLDQLFSRPGVLGAAAAFLGLMALTPLPKLPLLALGAGLGIGAVRAGLAPRRGGRGTAAAGTGPARRRGNPAGRGRTRPGLGRGAAAVKAAAREPGATASRRSPARSGWKTCCTSTRSSWRSASG